MDEKVLNAAIAGLLHDIGKMEQRSRYDPWNAAPGIDREGQPVHATWSLYFAEQYVYKPFRPAALQGAYHHAPQRSPAQDKSLSSLIALADKLSAGERADLSSESGTEKEPPRQMVTIFDRITFDGEGKRGDWHYLPLRPLALQDNALFPGESLPREAQISAYEILVEELRKAARQPIDHPQAYLENLLGGLQRATWCVPSSYYHSLPDVSLYDHSRMAAALAVCLADLAQTDVDNLLNAVTHSFQGTSTAEDVKLLDQPAVMLVGGDISGVQDFIYTISSKGAARTLRGRSFYLQLLTEAVLRYALGFLQIPYTNVIYSGGGHFYFLAPLAAMDRLAALRKAITLKLLKHHGASLYLAISSIPVPFGGFRIGRFPEHWKALHRSLAEAKLRKYTELDEQLYKLVFKVREFGGNPDDTCSVCGEDSRPTDILDEEREEQARICSLCESFGVDIGKRLPGSRFIALGFSAPASEAPGKASSVLAEFGMQVQFLEKAGAAVDLPGAEWCVLWAISDPEDDRWPETGNLPAARQLRYTVNQVPGMAFDELKEKVSGGFKRLGVLRMDVDNLGELFTRGFGETGKPDNLATLARLSTLSQQVSIFFEGWVKRILEQESQWIYAVYAGGDDLFLIAPWDITPGLAQRIYRDFQQYTANHPAFHISGGMSFIGGKYPVYQAAQDAAQAESLAKRLTGKDAFSFLGQAWKWQVFESLDLKQQRVEQIVSHQDEDAGALGGPQAVIQILRRLAEDEADQVSRMKGRPVWGPWMWNGPYLLTRMAERYKNTKPKLASAILALRDELDRDNYGEINQWGAAARWTQLKTREKKYDNK